MQKGSLSQEESNSLSFFRLSLANWWYDFQWMALLFKCVFVKVLPVWETSRPHKQPDRHRFHCQTVHAWQCMISWKLPCTYIVTHRNVWLADSSLHLRRDVMVRMPVFKTWYSCRSFGSDLCFWKKIPHQNKMLMWWKYTNLKWKV